MWGRSLKYYYAISRHCMPTCDTTLVLNRLYTCMYVSDYSIFGQYKLFINETISIKGSVVEVIVKLEVSVYHVKHPRRLPLALFK